MILLVITVMKLLMLTIDKDCGTDNATIDNWLFFEMGLIWGKNISLALKLQGEYLKGKHLQ